MIITAESDYRTGIDEWKSVEESDERKTAYGPSIRPVNDSPDRAIWSWAERVNCF